MTRYLILISVGDPQRATLYSGFTCRVEANTKSEAEFIAMKRLRKEHPELMARQDWTFNTAIVDDNSHGVARPAAAAGDMAERRRKSDT